jgi:hypothetical protein
MKITGTLIIALIISLTSIAQNVSTSLANEAHEQGPERIRWVFNTQLKVPFGPHTYQPIPVNSNIILNFGKLNPYYSVIFGVEGGFSYSWNPSIETGLHLGMMGTFYEEYNYRIWEYRNLVMFPFYASFKYNLFKGFNTVYLQADAGYNFLAQNFYANNNFAQISALERGGLLTGISAGIERDFYDKRFFFSLGYEISANNVRIYLQNLPIEWVGVTTGTRDFTEYKQNILVRMGMMF